MNTTGDSAVQRQQGPAFRLLGSHSTQLQCTLMHDDDDGDGATGKQRCQRKSIKQNHHSTGCSNASLEA